MFSTFLQQLKIMPNLIIDFNSSELYSFQIFTYEIYPEKKRLDFIRDIMTMGHQIFMNNLLGIQFI